MNPRLREGLFVLQFVGNIVVLGVIVALLLAASNNLSRTTAAQTEANRQILRHLQQVFIAHANASTKQNCAVASEIAFLVQSSPLAPPKLIERVNHFVHDACKVEVVPPLDIPPGQFASSSHPPSAQPSPGQSGQPTVGPTPTESPSPSPTGTCLPVIGCV